MTATATGMDAAFGPEHVVRRPVRTARAPGVASDFLTFAFSRALLAGTSHLHHPHRCPALPPITRDSQAPAQRVGRDIRKGDPTNPRSLRRPPFSVELTPVIGEVAHVGRVEVSRSRIHPVDEPLLCSWIVCSYADRFHQFRLFHVFPEELHFTFPVFDQRASIKSNRDGCLRRELQVSSIFAEDLLADVPIANPEIECSCWRLATTNEALGAGRPRGRQDPNDRDETAERRRGVPAVPQPAKMLFRHSCLR